MSAKEFTLSELAKKLHTKLYGNGEIPIRRLSTLQNATPDSLSFLASPAYHKHLGMTQAGAVILSPESARGYKGNALINDDPYLVFAKATHLFDTAGSPETGVHKSACIADNATIDSDASIAAHAVIESGVKIGKNVRIGAGTFIGANSTIGDHCVIHSNVSVYHGTTIGKHCTLHSGVVIGSDGFGFARDGKTWQKVAQIGNTVIGNHVEIGANTTIDRGALDDTIIEDNVILDNQIQIAHNVHIGSGTAIAANVGIAGSTIIGSNCLIGGGAGINGHLVIANGVKIAGMAIITKSINDENTEWSPGGIRSLPAREWRKNACRFNQLDNIFRHIKSLESQLSSMIGKQNSQN